MRHSGHATQVAQRDPAGAMRVRHAPRPAARSRANAATRSPDRDTQLARSRSLPARRLCDPSMRSSGRGIQPPLPRRVRRPTPRPSRDCPPTPLARPSSAAASPAPSVIGSAYCAVVVLRHDRVVAHPTGLCAVIVASFSETAYTPMPDIHCQVFPVSRRRGARTVATIPTRAEGGWPRARRRARLR